MMIYLSGPIKDDPYYKHNFLSAARAVKREYPDAIIINPAGLVDVDKDLTYSEYERILEMDFRILDACDAIYLIHNWQCSHGASLEYSRAKRNKMEILFDSRERGS